MSAIAQYWLEDLILLLIGIAFLNAALTGKLYSDGRGAKRLIVSVKSVPARVAFLSVSICIFAVFV